MDVTAFTKVLVEGPDAYGAPRPADRQPDAAETGSHHADPYAEPPRPDRTGNDRGRAHGSEDRFYLVCAAFFEQRLLDHLAKHRGPSERDVTSPRCPTAGRRWR
jgi:dimethylglycine dehydrogenase